MQKRITSGVVAAALAVAGFFGLISARSSPYYEIAATQHIQYQVAPRSWVRWGPATSLSEQMAEARERLLQHKGASFVIKPKGRDSWSRARNLFNTIKVLKLRLGQAEVGQVWFVKALSDGFQLKSRKVDKNPAVVKDTVGTLPVDIVAGTTFNRYPTLRDAGIFACRRVSGSWTWSQHAYANAIDLTGDVSVLDKAAHWLHGLVLKGYLPASQILWRGRNLITGSSVSGHYYHIHVSGRPLMSGTPACAR